MRSILLVESDSAQGIQMKSVIEQNFPNVVLEYFSGPDQALTAFRATHHNLIITELAFDGGEDGLDFIQKALTERRQTQIFVVSDFPVLGDISAMFAETGNIRFFKKPLQVPEFYQIVGKELAKMPNSIVSGFNPANFLQMVQMERLHGYLELVTSDGSGFLCFEQGKLYSAIHGEYLGDDAVIKMLLMEISEIRVFEGNYRAEVNVKTPLNKILLDYCQTKDEQTAAAGNREVNR